MRMTMQGKVACIALVGSLLAQGVSGSVALGAPTDTAAPTNTTLVKTFTYTQSEDAPEIKDEIFERGYSYKLRSSETHTEEATITMHRELNQECAEGEGEATLAAMATSVHVDEDDIVGDIPRVSSNIEDVMTTVSWQCEEAVVYEGLLTNDVNQLPETREFYQERSGNTVAMTRAGVTWAIGTEDGHTAPNTWTATVIYRGTDSMPMVDHQLVTAIYEGDVPNPRANEITVTATYEREVTPEPIQEIQEIQEIVSEEQDTNLIAPIATTTAVAAGAIWFFFWWKKRRKKGVYDDEVA